jgi:hypothetical protein
MKTGAKMAAVAVEWRALGDEGQEAYNSKAHVIGLELAAAQALKEGPAAPKAKAEVEAAPASSGKAKPKRSKEAAQLAAIRQVKADKAQPEAKVLSAYQLFAKGKMKGGMKMAEVAAEWRALGEKGQADFKAAAKA